jgi:Tol biopolymer transport system component
VANDSNRTTLAVGGLLVLLACAALVPADRAGSAPTSPAILFERKGDLYAVAADRSRVVRLTRTRQDELEPAVSPDGSTIAFTNEAGGISTLTLDGLHRRVVTRDGESPAWAPDGQTIYFIRLRQQTRYSAACGSIFRVSVATRQVRRVTNTARTGHFHTDPAVAPDGTRIAFSDWDACEGGTSSPRLRVVDSNGRPTQDLAKLRRNGYWPDPEHSSPAWSPDGTRLAYKREGDLAVVNRDGSGDRRVTRGGTSLLYESPAWSPDGEWIAYLAASLQSPAYRLLVVHPDGTRLHGVARNISSLGGWLPSLPQDLDREAGG